MNKIVFEIGDKKYEIVINRKLLVALESFGIPLTEFKEKPMSAIYYIVKIGLDLSGVKDSDDITDSILDTYDNGKLLQKIVGIIENFMSSGKKTV